MSKKSPKANIPSTDNADTGELALNSSEPSEIKDSSSAPEEDVVTHSIPKKAAKIKLIRDSFTFPAQDYEKISTIKKACLAEGMNVKKSEILRAGLHLLTNLNLADLKQALDQVEKLPTGRPKSS